MEHRKWHLLLFNDQKCRFFLASRAVSHEKQFYLDRLSSVLAKQAALPADSHITRALSREFVDWIRDKIDRASENDLEYSYRPPVYGLIDAFDSGRLAELDADINLVLA